MRNRAGQTLVFDADDTLWENNVLFERVIDDFMEWLRHPTLDRTAIRAVFNDIEAANTVAHGYGSQVFLRSLGECFAHLQDRPATEVERQEIDALAVALVEHRVELVPEVAATLAELGTRHELLLLTKGQRDEQQNKVDVSGLGHHFRNIHIVTEKNVDTYRWLVAQESLSPAQTWMIGNSPKSDINPARLAGLNAVFIPNDNTWVLEHEDVDPSDTGVMRLERFRDLLAHF
ncbi:MAG: HAD family hydrolase [Actinomycetota bacterium]|nr:HAD family hydrolase [Actinomycetota bacterium]